MTSSTYYLLNFINQQISSMIRKESEDIKNDTYKNFIISIYIYIYIKCRCIQHFLPCRQQMFENCRWLRPLIEK